MTPIQKASKRLADIEQIPDNLPVTTYNYKNVLRDIVRLEYMIETLDNHIIETMKSMRTPLLIENTPYNALLLASYLDPANPKRKENE
jgi:hypothetical protein